ncbi:hypothetical protein DOJK_02101 [Patescibacteria group bacterium]|nr:hypothetical protein DOJK_02101 [Patescibacteria group bacterium]
MKTPNDIRKMEDRLTAFLMINDVQIGTPLSQKNHAHVLGFEYDAMSHTVSIIIPEKLKKNLVSFFKKQGIDSFYSHDIADEAGFINFIVYL